MYPLKNLPYCMTFGHAPILSGVLPSFLKPGSRLTFGFFLLQLWNQLFLEGVLNLITGCCYLQTQIWVLGVLNATHVLLLLCPLSEQARKYMHVTSIYTHRKIHIFVCICVFMYVCMYVFQYIDVVPLLSCVWLSETLWTAAGQASLSIMSQSLLKLMSIQSVMPSKHLIFSCPLLLPSIFRSIWVFPYELALPISGQSIGASIQHQSFQWIFKVDSLGLTGLVSLLSKGLLRTFFENIISLALSLVYGPTLTSICDYWKNHSFD